MRFLDPSRWDASALGAAWRSAQPFPHVILDDSLSPEALAELRDAVTREPHWPAQNEIYSHMASSQPPAEPRLRAFLDELGGHEIRQALSAITGKALAYVDGRSYVYLPGQHLLPHSDFRNEIGRAISYALYLSPEGTFQGGELELFRCEMQGEEIVSTEPAGLVAPLPNRLVFFDTSPASLHRVREVLHGMRASVAGWFYT